MNIFNVEPGFDDFRETARFNFFWRLFLVGTLLTLIYSVVNFFFFPEVVKYYISAFILDSIILIFLWKYKRHYKWFAGIFSLLAFNALGISLFDNYLVTELHVQAILWMLMICILVYFTISNKVGVIFIAGIMIYFSVYYNFYFSSDILKASLLSLSELSVAKTLVLTMGLVLPLIVVAYTMNQYNVVNNNAMNSAMNALNDLKNEKQVVENQNQEKTILLQEIHHRVKNNLQIIISLLRLQSRDLDSEEAKSKFEDAIARIMAMSLIHQKMYERETLVQIDIEEYFNSLINNLIEIQAGNQKIAFQIGGNLKTLSGDILIPIGLITNELVSNTLKHAFDKKNPNDPKEIIIEFNQDESETILFKYHDNGSWKLSEKLSFGTELIELFTEQLDGTLEKNIDDNGTTYYFQLQSNIS